MPPLVSDTLMDDTWKRVAMSSPAEIRRLQQRHGKEQDPLTSFVIGLSMKLREDAMGLALYANAVITEAFRRSGATFREVTAGKIMRTWETAQAQVAALKAAGRESLDQQAESMCEPAVFHYILGALTPEENDDLELDDDEFWYLLGVLKTVSDCLHDARKSR